MHDLMRMHGILLVDPRATRPWIWTLLGSLMKFLVRSCELMHDLMSKHGMLSMDARRLWIWTPLDSAVGLARNWIWIIC